MSNKGKQQERRLLSWIMLLVLVAVVAFGNRGLQIYQLNNALQDAATHRDALSAENRELTETIASLQNETVIEQMAREKLNMIYPGETHYLPALRQDDVLKYQPMEGEILD